MSNYRKNGTCPCQTNGGIKPNKFMNKDHGYINTSRMHKLWGRGMLKFNDLLHTSGLHEKTAEYKYNDPNVRIAPKHNT